MTKSGQFFTQLKVLAWKNYILKTRNWSILLLEMVVPVIVILGMWGLRAGVVKPVRSKVDLPAYVSASVDNFDNQYTNICTGQNLVWNCVFKNYRSCPSGSSTEGCQQRYIAVAPKDASNAVAAEAAGEFISWAETTFASARNYSTFVYFNSEQDFEDYIGQSEYSIESSIDIFSTAVIFNSGAPAWDYTLRLNKTQEFTSGDESDNPTTIGPVVDNTLKTGSQTPNNGGNPYLETWSYNYYYTLANVVNSYIATATCRNASSSDNEYACTGQEGTQLGMAGGVQFPNKEVLTNGFWSAIGSSFALLMIISLIYPCSNIIKTLVEEKESKLREGMYMMAMRSDSWAVSWGFHFLCLFLPLSIIITFAASGLFEYSDGIYIWLYFFLFFMSATSFCVFVSNFISRARTAAIIGSLLFFAGYFIYLGLTLSALPSRSSLLAAMLHPASAFAFGTLFFTEYEDAQVGITRYTWNESSTYPISFADVLLMMLIDAIYLVFVGWYVSMVWPSEFGTHKHWYFIVDPRYYWSGIKPWLPQQYSRVRTNSGREVSPENSVQMVDKQEHRSDSPSNGFEPNEKGAFVEVVPQALAMQKDSKTCVEIKDLVKSFNTPTGKKTAVDGLSLTMYSGHITALLGHNGAGKSTVVNMMTGLFPPDSGDATIEGLGLAQNMDEIRRNLGVCPQHDVLFPDLTVEEHLIMFASFKGTPRDKLKDEVEKMIQSVGLTEKRHSLSKTLSGGQKRKLSVGLAFIGGSRIVFLDEPTSGMDPYSRRFTWNVIRQHREGRVVVLITHFMDEADLLCDRIAIMGDGRLLCCGSSLYLKQIYGVGYNMIVEKVNPVSFDSDKMKTTIQTRIPEAKVITDVGTEMTFSLPFTASGSFQSLFEQLDSSMEGLGLQSYGISVTTLEEVFLKVAQGTNTMAAANAGKSKNKQLGSASHDSHDGGGGAGPSVAVDEIGSGHSGKGSTKQIAVKPKQQADGEYGLVATGDEAEAISKGVPVSGGAFGSGSCKFEKEPQEAVVKTFFLHTRAVFIKRMLYFVRDSRAWVYQFFVPVLFVLAGMLVMQFTSNDPTQPLKQMSIDMFNTKVNSDVFPLPYNADNTEYVNYKFTDGSGSTVQGAIYYNMSGVPQDTMMNSLQSPAEYPLLPCTDCQSFLNMSSYLLYDVPAYESSVFGALSITNAGPDEAYSAGATGTIDNGYSWFGGNKFIYYVHANYTGIFAGPVMQSLAADAAVRTINSSHSVKSSMFPLPTTAAQKRQLDSFQVDIMITFLILAFACIPAAFASNVVREREFKSKPQQLVSGMSIPAYWTGTFLWDVLSYQITVGLTIILFVAFPGTGAVSSDKTLGYSVALLVLFGTAVAPFTYLMSNLFRSSSSAQIGMLMINFIIGFALSIVSVVLRILPSSRGPYNSVIRYVLNLSPLCALGDALHSMALIQVWSVFELGGSRTYDVDAWKITGLPLMMLGIDTVGYLLIVIAYEYINQMPALQSFFAIPVDQRVMNRPVEGKDQDVLAEEARIASKIDHPSVAHDPEQPQNNADISVIEVRNVKKMYPGGKFAVKGVSLGIPNGECFGLLGINGAGKTTLLSILCGEFPPTTGQVTLNGLDIQTNITTCRRNIGFCPQFDALFELMTAREHLTFYARVKGIVESDVARVVNEKIAEMGLTEYADRLAGTYSGGNKRKLSVAMAMIGEPTIVFLDEPSTGMDPGARRFMWDVISDIVTKREKCSLVLTTHAMEEAEALCTRIGVMVGGVMRCLGSPQHLRTLYGDGFQIEINMDVPTPEQIDAQVAAIVQLVGGKAALESVDRAAMTRVFQNSNHAEWVARITPEGTGNDLHAALENNAAVNLKHLASWWILETQYDAISNFLNGTFSAFRLHERQIAKLRVEISSKNPDGSPRKLSQMFGAIETKKAALKIQGYSISQTSLEQIFNSFAAQQEEEKGVVIGGGR